MDPTDYKALVKKYFLWTVSLCVLGPALFFALLYAQDPMQFFHRAEKDDSLLSPDMRAQAAGILNTFDVDSLILGTSMLENTSAAEASAKLGGKFFNISISGGNFAERALLLKHALQKDRKNIIYSLDRYYFTCPGRDNRIPAYLYDDNPFNDIKYYATQASLKRLLQPNWGLRRTGHDRPNAWFHIPDHRDRFGGIDHWVANRENPQVKGFLRDQLPQAARVFPGNVRQEAHDQAKEKRAREYIEKYLLEIIRNHNHTNFYLIFPPYSRFVYANMRRNEPQNFFLHQEIIRYLVNRTKDSKNIHIFGFEDMDFPDDIANYKDISHYHQKFNSLFLDAIAEGKHELTPENVEGYLKRCEQKAWDYDIPALNAEVQRLLRAADAKANGKDDPEIAVEPVGDGAPQPGMSHGAAPGAPRGAPQVAGR